MIYLFVLLGCQAEEKPLPISEPAMEETPEVGAEEEPLGEVGEEPARSLGRKFKRMTVPQVRDAMEQVSGGIVWKGNSSDWNDYADTLGVPDYEQRVTEDLSPSAMYQKFLDDAAVYTCSEWLDAEEDGDSQLFFSTDSEDDSRESVDQNI